VFVEAVLAVVLAGVVAVLATGLVAGYVVAGVALLVGVAGLVRRQGRSVVDVVRDRLRDPRESVSDNGSGDLGAPRRLVPALHVVDVATRTAGPVGVAGDGRGFVVALDAAVSATRSWRFADVVGRARADDVRPAAVQLLLEQRSTRRAGGGGAFAPGRTYRSLPTAAIPLWCRGIVVLRHEPTWAPETVAARGGGAAGTRSALTALATRMAAYRGVDGVALTPLDATGLARLFRELGDPGPDCEAREHEWTTSTACHAVVSLVDPAGVDLAALLDAAAELDIDRCVATLSVSVVDNAVTGALRVVAPDLEHVRAAVGALVERGLAAPLGGLQEEGVVATLPLGGGARSTADLVNQVR
jgi:hypothetical protein